MHTTREIAHQSSTLAALQQAEMARSHIDSQAIINCKHHSQVNYLDFF